MGKPIASIIIGTETIIGAVESILATGYTRSPYSPETVDFVAELDDVLDEWRARKAANDEKRASAARKQVSA